MPGKRPKGQKARRVEVNTSRSTKSLAAEAEAAVRADALCCSLESGKTPTHAAVWDRAGRVTVFKSSVAGDGCGWMHSEFSGEELNIARMLASFETRSKTRHYLSSEVADREKVSCSIAHVVNHPKTLNHVPDILLRWLVDSGASQHVIPSGFVNKNRGQFAESFCPIDNGSAFETANGLVKPEGEVMAWVRQLDRKLKFVMMPDCPRIISMGKLVKEQRLAFHWYPGQRPYLENCSTGEIAWLDDECDTPVMPRHLRFVNPGWDPLVKNMMCPLRNFSSLRRRERKSRRTVLTSSDSSDRSESTGSSGSPVTSESSRGLGGTCAVARQQEASGRDKSSSAGAEQGRVSVPSVFEKLRN